MNYNPILPKGQSCVHIIVVWHSAMSKKDEIINDLNKDFQVIKVFRGHWDADKFLENYRRICKILCLTPNRKESI